MIWGKQLKLIWNFQVLLCRISYFPMVSMSLTIILPAFCPHLKPRGLQSSSASSHTFEEKGQTKWNLCFPSESPKVTGILITPHLLWGGEDWRGHMGKSMPS